MLPTLTDVYLRAQAAVHLPDLFDSNRYILRHAAQMNCITSTTKKANAKLVLDSKAATEKGVSQSLVKAPVMSCGSITGPFVVIYFVRA